MIKTLCKHVALLIVSVLVTAPHPAHAQSIEVMHYWTSPGETEALNIFADAYTQNGGAWEQVGVPTKLSMRRRAIERIVMGFPPTAAQWHAGPELDELFSLGLVSPMDDVADPEALRGHLQPAVIEAITRDGVLAALPVGIHGVNWAWYNNAIYEELNLDIPEDWRGFLDQAPTIAAAGYEPLALGDWNWEAALLFNTVLIDIAGKSVFEKMLSKEPLTEAERTGVSDAVGVFRAVRDFASPKPAAPAEWSAATSRVIERKAALQVMGDWAKGAFVAAGQSPGTDFTCRLAPGNDDALMFLLDVFVLAASEAESAQTAQSALVETLLDPGNQLAFAKLKGALPVVRDFDRSALDECAQLGLSKFDQADTTVSSVAISFTVEEQAMLETAVLKLWHDAAQSDEEAAEAFLRTMFK